MSYKLILAYCWYHLRRDFIRVAKKNKSSTAWSLQWLKKIREIEKLNNARVENFKNNECYEDIQQDLVTKVNAFFSDASQSLKVLLALDLKNMFGEITIPKAVYNEICYKKDSQEIELLKKWD